MFAKVIVEYPIKTLNKTFIYKIPENLINILKVGMKVYVPFNVSEIFGIVIKILPQVEDEGYEIKEIIRVVDEELVLNDELLKLGKFLADSTFCNLITAYQTMLPSSLKIKKQKKNYQLFDEIISIKNLDKISEYCNKYPRRKKHIEFLERLKNEKEILKKGILKTVIESLIKEDIIKIKKENKYRINIENKHNKINELTPLQNKVYESVEYNKYNTYLLYGITGSGKTEIYIKWVENCIKLGKRAIVLVPEIGLTTQIALRFYNAFGSDVAILHSSLSIGEKYDEYLKIMRGEVKVVIGTRSAIFAPVSNLGIIIIDEEDSYSYKQDSTPKYHARDMAIFRGKYNNIPVILGSATPSLESKARADKNVYKLLRLNQRVGNGKLPEVTIVDMNEEIKKRNFIISDILKEKIQNRLDKKEQIIIFLNRRGFSTFITCSNCGYTYKCPNCDITLTYHKSTNNLICHYCGEQIKKDDKCPKCLENSLNYYGLGTEKLEEVLKNMYKGIKIIRMDQDTTRNKGMHEKIIKEFKEHKYDLLLGTQMVSKGLDFSNVSLVGVINADTSLNIPDYRSSENTFSLLCQVAGRAGRANITGEVIIQTYNPDNYVIRYVSKNNYDDFYKTEMLFRKKLKYPPYYYLISIKVVGKDYNKTLEDAKKVKAYLSQNIEKETIILGPTTAAVLKFNNEYRMQIIIKYKFDKLLLNTLKELDTIFINNKNSYLDIDFNPMRI